MTANAASAALSAAPASPAAPAAPAAAPAAPASNANWYDGIQDQGTKDWVVAKGFKDSDSLAHSAFNLEKLMGHDKAGRTFVLPDDKSTPEEIAAYHTKIGVPADPKEYLRDLKLPDGHVPEYAEAMSAAAKAAGLTPKQFAALNEHNTKFATEYQAKAAEAQSAKSTQEYTEVVKEWGKEADANIELGRRAIDAFFPGKDRAEKMQSFDALESAMGTGAALRLISKIGANMGEHRMVEGSDQGVASKSVAEARMEVTRLTNDPVWTKDYATNKAKQEQMWKLSQIIGAVA